MPEMLSAPASIPATREGTFTSALEPLLPGTVTCSRARPDRPADSASAITGTSPARASRLSSSNSAVNLWGTRTTSAPVAQRDGTFEQSHYRWPQEHLAVTTRPPNRRIQAEPSSPHRIDGPGRCRRRQRRDGIILRTAPEERAGPEAVADPRRAADRDHHLDREDLSPTPSAGSAGPVDPHRIRDHHEPGREPRGLTPQLSPDRAAVPPGRPCRTYRGHRPLVLGSPRRPRARPHARPRRRPIPGHQRRGGRQELG